MDRSTNNVILWRPVGLEELALIFESSMVGYPPRLPEQPIFYPVLNRGYAEQIARDWNTASGACAGYVTRFQLQCDYAEQFQRRRVGGQQHEELWVPAEAMDEFNSHIEGPIVVESAYFGPGFRGHIPTRFGLMGRNAVDQLRALATSLDNSTMDFIFEFSANSKTIFVNFPYWVCCDLAKVGLSEDTRLKTCDSIEKVWEETEPPARLVRNASRTV